MMLRLKESEIPPADAGKPVEVSVKGSNRGEAVSPHVGDREGIRKVDGRSGPELQGLYVHALCRDAQSAQSKEDREVLRHHVSSHAIGPGRGKNLDRLHQHCFGHVGGNGARLDLLQERSRFLGPGGDVLGEVTNDDVGVTA